MVSRSKITLFVIGMLILAACSPQIIAPPPGSIASTPVDDLPVSIRYTDPLVELPTPVSEALIQEADADFLLLTNIYERSAPSVVNIEAFITAANGETNVNRGSGFVYDIQGYIITTAHVIKNAERIRITFNNGYVTDGRLIGVDTFSDLGVLQVHVALDRLHPLPLMPDSDTIRVGQRAIAIGNPFGLNSSMSAGIVSGIGRTLRSAELIDADAPTGFQNPAIIQTDTPINPGNSGGPLLNSNGEVMGVATAIRTDNGIFQGVGFAVPSNTVGRVIPELIASGHVDYAWMGISVTPEDNGYHVAGLAEELKLPVDAGVLIRGVTVGSPADRAGLHGGTEVINVRGQPVCIGGDIIVAIDGTYVNNMDELVAYLLVNAHPGDRAVLRVVRDRETFEVAITLQARPDRDALIRDCEG